MKCKIHLKISKYKTLMSLNGLRAQINRGLRYNLSAKVFGVLQIPYALTTKHNNIIFSVQKVHFLALAYNRSILRTSKIDQIC